MVSPGRIDWEAALGELRARSRGGAGARARRLLADGASLSALPVVDYAIGAARIAEAIELEPLNPLHALRRVLLRLRFGQWEDALAGIRTVEEALPNLPLVRYLKALAYLRQGDLNRAKIASGELAALHPRFAPGQFLQVEVMLHVRVKGIEKYLHALPRQAELAPAWADLLAKLVLLHPSDGTKLAESYLKQPPLVHSPEAAAALRRALTFHGLRAPAGAVGELDQALAQLAPGSRAEQLALLFLHEAIEHSSVETGTHTLVEARAVYERHPERKAARRIYAAALTRRAVEQAATSRFVESIRTVEVCLRLEPHETIHHQNRAALFTLLREEDGYHDAWADLDRHHYRLVLLGKTDPVSALAVAKPHRMFAQQARLTPEEPDRSKPRLHLGVFREEWSEEDKDAEPVLAVNQERIDADPEQLRQWIHHRRAELVFAHLALGAAPQRYLLHPGEPRVARARAEALAKGAESLAVLVPEEGRRLADALGTWWMDRAGRVITRYSAVEGTDKDVQALLRAHLETLGDLALLAGRFAPAPRRLDLIEELLEFLAAEAPFFDEVTLLAMLADKERRAPYPIRLLAALTRETLRLDDDLERHVPLPERLRKKVTDRFASRLLLSASVAAVKEGGVARALPWIDRARQASDDDPQIELFAARLLIAGEFHDDAAKALSRVHTLHQTSCQTTDREKPNPHQTELEELQRLLDEAKKSRQKSRKRVGLEPAEADGERRSSRASRVAPLEQEIERFPSSIQSYEEIARALGGEGRLGEACEWSERAMARCLSREGQTRARGLNLEMLGLKALAPSQAQAVKLYLAGTHGPLLQAIESIPDGERAKLPYPVDYVRGLSLLAARRRSDAQGAFVTALRRCDRQLHLAVLRPLAADVEQALLEQVRRIVNDALAEGRFEDASREAAATLGELHAPESLVIDLGRIRLAQAIAHLGTETAQKPMPPLAVAVPWRRRLDEAVAAPDDLGRARRLSELAMELHPPSKKEADSILRKVEALEEQLRVARAYAESGRLLREGRHAEALAALDGAGPVGEREPRVLRQRALLCLRLERFEDADAAVKQLAGATDALARELSARYPELRFQHRINAVNRLLRAGDLDAAGRILAGTQAPGEKESLELAYCAAFRLAQDAYRRHEKGDTGAAVKALAEALDLVEEKLALAEKHQHARLLELHRKLDKEVTDLEAQR